MQSVHRHTLPHIPHTACINKSDGTLTLLHPWGLLLPYILLAFDVEFLIFIKQPPALMTGFFRSQPHPRFAMGLLTSGWCCRTHTHTHTHTHTTSSHLCVCRVLNWYLYNEMCHRIFLPASSVLRNSRRSYQKPQLALKICWHFHGFLIVKFQFDQDWLRNISNHFILLTIFHFNKAYNVLL